MVTFPGARAVLGPDRTGRDAAWVELIGRLTAGGRLRPAEAAADCLQAALEMLGADGASLIDWSDGGCEVVAVAGFMPTFDHRPSAGTGRTGTSAVATVSVDPRTDLIAARSDGGDFIPDDLAVLAALAALLGWSGAGRGGLQQLLQGFVARPMSSSVPAEVLTASAEAAAHLLEAEIAGVLLLSEDGESVEMRAAVGNSQLATSQLRIRRGEGLAGKVLTTGHPQRIADYTTEQHSTPDLVALSYVEGTCSAMAVPMVRDGSLVGVMCVWRRRRELFTEADEALLGSLAGLCAAAIHNADTHAALRERLTESHAEGVRLAAEEASARGAAELQWALNRITRDRDDLSAVLRTVGAAAGCSVTVVDNDGRTTLWDSLTAPRDLDLRLAAWVAERSADLDADDVDVAELPGGWMIVAPVRAVGVALGHLALGFACRPVPAQELTARQAAAAAAVLLYRAETVVTAARRAQSEFVWDLLDGRLPDEVEASLRAQHLGSGFAMPARVVAVSTPGLTAKATRATWTADQIERSRSSTARLITSVLVGAGVPVPVLAARADLFAVLVPLGTHDDRAQRTLIAKALAAVRWPGEMDTVVGIGGRLDHVARCSDGWREAVLAASAATPGVPAAFEDLGVLQYLLAPTTRPQLEEFAARRIGELTVYDQQHGTDLVETLEWE